MLSDKRRRGSRCAHLGFGFLTITLTFAAASAQGQAGQPDPRDDAGTLSAGEVPVPAPPPKAGLPQVEPIIPDQEFNSSVPELDPADDPEMGAPLESIAEFERRLAAEEADADPAEGLAPPLNDPVLSDQDTFETIGDAPIRDAELTQPLPPIDTFELSPVELAEAEEDAEPVEVAYRIDILGLEEADRETETDLRGMFNDLSALRKDGREAANIAMVSARLTEDSELMKTILAAEGWYRPEVSTRLDRTETEEGEALTAVIEVSPGKRYEFADIIIQADPTEPPELIAESLPLKVGEPIVAERVQAAEANVAVQLPQNGYPFAEIGQRDILLDPDTGGGVYTLPVTTGPRSRFGGFETDGDLAFDADHIEVLARFERGELYDSRDVDDLRKALVATGLFSTVSVEPRQSGEPAGDGTEYATIFVDQEAGPARTIAGSAGYGTGEGFRLEGTWTHRNMFPPEGALIAHGIAGTREQGAGVTFRRSNAGRRDRTVELVAEARHSDFDAYSAYTGRIAGRVSYDSTPIWQKRFTYSYGVELLATAERDYDFDLGRRNRRTYYIGGLNGQVGFDTTTNNRDESLALLDPTDGFRLTALIQPEGSIGRGFNPYVRARLDGSAYFSVSDSLVLAGRFRLGTIQGAERVEIAPSRRLYAGGGGSVRGYGYQELGPQDPNGDPIGGRSLNEAAAEVRYRFGNFGVVAFFDAGQSYESTTPRFSNLQYGAGIGGRYYTNFGPLRVDIATPLNRRPGDSRINVYVSIGQAF